MEALEAEQERIEKANRRKQDEYDEKVKKGQQRAKELNARFADWYYVVGDETYRKIHLGQAEIVKKKGPQERQGIGDARRRSRIHSICRACRAWRRSKASPLHYFFRFSVCARWRAFPVSSAAGGI